MNFRGAPFSPLYCKSSFFAAGPQMGLFLHALETVCSVLILTPIQTTGFIVSYLKVGETESQAG